MILLASVLLTSACAHVEPAAKPDPAGAQAYVAVGQAELAAGSSNTALVAYQEAARLDPDNADVRAMLESLCAPAVLDELAHDPFEDGVALLDDGEPAAALVQFKLAREKSADAGVALMEGICEYELDDDDAARPLLLEAEKDSDTATQARLFLGLVAMRAGDRAEAASRFASAGGSADPRLSALAGDLLKLSRREGRLFLGIALDPRFDTNVGLSPDGTPSAPSVRTPDGAAALSVNLTARPFGHGSGLYLGATGVVRRQFEQVNYSFGGLGATVGWEWARNNLLAATEYGFESYALGKVSPYLVAHRVLASAHWTPGRLSLGASYRGRIEAFYAPYADYSGLRNALTLDAAWRFEEGSSVSLSWRGEDDHTARIRVTDETVSPPQTFSSSLSYQETGPWLQGLWRASEDLRVGLQLGLFDRDFLDFRRNDLAVHGELYGEHDVGEHFVVRLSFGGHHTESTVDSATYSNVFGSVGVAWVRGFL